MLDRARVEALVRAALKDEGITVTGADILVPVSVSARHLHLCAAHLEALFGRGFALTRERDISQPGQYASGQFVRLEGPKGSIEKLRVLGPLRSETQVELAMSDARRIGLDPPVRGSGDIAGSPGGVLHGPAGSVRLGRGILLAERHIHMTPEEAAGWGFSDGESLRVRLDTRRGGTLDDVIVRVGAHYALDLHLDTDDANAFLIPEGIFGRICRNDLYRPNGS